MLYIIHLLDSELIFYRLIAKYHISWDLFVWILKLFLMQYLKKAFHDERKI